MDQATAEARISDFMKGEPTLSTIPVDIPREKLRVRHGGYDTRAAGEDFNTVLPLDGLLELEREGVIGDFLGDAYSFVGACSQKRLMNHVAPRWANMLKEQEVEGNGTGSCLTGVPCVRGTYCTHTCPWADRPGV